MRVETWGVALATLRKAAAGLVAASVFFFAVATLAEARPIPGVQAHLMWAQYNDAAVDWQLDRAQAAGAQLVRVDVGWASFEPTAKGQYDQSYLNRLDSVVSKAEARGIKVLVTVWETPCWASSAPDDLKQSCTGSWWSRGVQRYTPTNPQDYADGLAYLVRRYGTRIAGYEVWNEPNDAAYYKSPDPIGTYASLLRTAYPAAKAANPDATIVGGSLSYADNVWTQGLYDRGVKGSFDAWSIHPYTEDRSPLDPGSDQWIKASFIRGVPLVHDVMVQNGDNKPLWLTEFGYSTCTVRDAAAWQNCVDPSVQADWLKQAYNAMASWDYVAVGVWFKLQDTSADTSDRNANYGLLNYDGSEKLSYAAYRDAAAALAQGTTTSTGTTTTSTGSGSGGKKKPKRTTVRLRISRSRGHVYAHGTAPRGTIVVLRSFRYIRGSHQFANRAASRRKVHVNRAGRFRARLPKRVRRGKWRVTARTAYPQVSIASAHTR